MGYGKDEFFKWGQKRGRDVFFAWSIPMKSPNKTLISSGFIIYESAGSKQIILFHREDPERLADIIRNVVEKTERESSWNALAEKKRCVPKTDVRKMK